MENKKILYIITNILLAIVMVLFYLAFILVNKETALIVLLVMILIAIINNFLFLPKGKLFELINLAIIYSSIMLILVLLGINKLFSIWVLYLFISFAILNMSVKILLCNEEKYESTYLFDLISISLIVIGIIMCFFNFSITFNLIFISTGTFVVLSNFVYEVILNFRYIKWIVFRK